MSRLIVKGLPKVISEEKLRKLFSEKGTVTDIQLKYTKDGVFRQFAFIGFKTSEEAQSALTYFNNSFINTSRINVQYCTELGATDKPKSWSKYSADSSAFKQKHQTYKDGKQEKKTSVEQNSSESEIKALLNEHKNDPLFNEFMELHKKNTAEEDWSGTLNETQVSQIDEKIQDSSDHSEEQSSEDEESKEKPSKSKLSDFEYLKTKKTTSNQSNQEKEKSIVKDKTIDITKEIPKYYIVKIRGLTMKIKKKDLKEFFHPLKPKFHFPPKLRGFAYVCFKTEKEMKQALEKNKSFLGGKRIWITQEVEKKNDEASVEKDTSKWKSQEENLKTEETIAESGRIFVRNLAYTSTEEEIEKLFSASGPVTEVSLPIDKLSRKSKGFAMVTFLMPEHAVAAYTKLDGTIFQGRMLHLLPGKAKHSIDELLEKDGLSYKDWKNIKTKSQAGSSHNWNSLFLGQNAVVDVMAATYGTSKEELLNAEGNASLAVRVALGETQIVKNTRDFLEENGVSLDAFNQPPKQRSKNVILVKNLPADTKKEEIYNLFQPFGVLGRVLLPPSGVTAIVEFSEPYEARIAFTKLAYTKFKHSPLYLEWAPLETFTTKSLKDQTNKNTLKEENNDNKEVVNKVENSSEKNDESSSEEDDFPEPDTTLFIKGLNFTTKEEAIKEHFKNCGPIHYINIAKKKDTKNPGQFLSMGYGFIQFKKTSSADKALKTLQHSKIEEFSIELKKSNRALINEVPSNRKVTNIGKQTTNKILVKNIAFQATHKEVFDLFSPFGEIKHLRLPKKMAGTGNHRGFAFVDYMTKSEAKKAFKNLCQSTHLYGRKLVLEWANNEENLDVIRKRAAKMFDEGPANKNFKKGVFEVEENKLEEI